jgi:hypothetical protein
MRLASRYEQPTPTTSPARGTAQLNRVKARSAQLNATAGHVTAFAEMTTGRHDERLPEWLAAADLDDLPTCTPSLAASAATRPPR